MACNRKQPVNCPSAAAAAASLCCVSTSPSADTRPPPESALASSHRSTSAGHLLTGSLCARCWCCTRARAGCQNMQISRLAITALKVILGVVIRWGSEAKTSRRFPARCGRSSRTVVTVGLQKLAASQSKQARRGIGSLEVVRRHLHEPTGSLPSWICAISQSKASICCDSVICEAAAEFLRSRDLQAEWVRQVCAGKASLSAFFSQAGELRGRAKFSLEAEAC